MRRHLAAFGTAFALVGLAGAGCNGILGFDERTFDACTQYCDTILNTCVQANAQYQDAAGCQATCAILPQGSSDEPVGNTVACRFETLQQASETGAVDALCPAAGPAGFNDASQQVCGDRCTIYCELMKQICAGRSSIAELDLETCLTECSNVPDNPAYDPSNGDIKDHDDSIQCRFWHLSVATTAPDPHCAHADGTTKCDGVFSNPTSSSSSGM
jgi:hypothetical protein